MDRIEHAITLEFINFPRPTTCPRHLPLIYLINLLPPRFQEPSSTLREQPETGIQLVTAADPED